MGKEKITLKAISIANKFKINVEEFNSAEELLKYITDQTSVLKEASIVVRFHKKLRSGAMVHVCRNKL